MSVSASNSNTSSQIWQRFLTKADGNGDSQLNASELEAVAGQHHTASSIAQMIKAFDEDGNGQLTLPELTANPFPKQLQTLVELQESGGFNWQEIQADNQRIIEQFFERADLDRDGVLSKDEWTAEIAFNRTRYLVGEGQDDRDAYVANMRQFEKGYINSDPVEWEDVRPEDLGIFRSIKLILSGAPEKELPAEVRERFEKAKSRIEEIKKHPDYVAPPSPEERREMMASKLLNTDLTGAYMSRLFDQLADAVSSKQTDDAIDVMT